MSVSSPPRPVATDLDLSAPDRPLAPLPAGWHSLPAAMLASARANWSKVAMVDSLGTTRTFGEALIGTLILARLFRAKLGPEKHVGLLVPPGVAGAVANMAIAALGKVAVNLNYSASKAVVDSSVAQCGITQIITTPRILDKVGFKPSGELIFLEDFAKAVTWRHKLRAAALAKLAPASLLAAKNPGFGPMKDEPATVIFTSGSTGDPKGVVLSHGNILSNVHQINSHLSLLPDEVLMGVLPFFHSFGYSVSIWTASLLAKKVVFHYSPLDARVVADLIEKNGATLIAASPTFMRNYAERAKPGQLSSLVHVILGSEKLKPEVAEVITAKVGRPPLEGYGCTELSPVVSVNIPQDITTPDGRTIPGNKPGTTGRPLPGTAIKTTDPDTGADLPRGVEGLVWVKGPQVMMGYLNKPEATAKVLKDGWYCTGDMGYLDADGFLKLTGRLSRFAKVGGEMVPLEAVESAILSTTGASETALAVTTVPDIKRGERLVVLYTDMGRTPEEVCQSLGAGPMAKLWIPSPRDFVRVEEIPVLAVGKRDLKRVREIAAERLG